MFPGIASNCLAIEFNEGMLFPLSELVGMSANDINSDTQSSVSLSQDSTPQLNFGGTRIGKKRRTVIRVNPDGIFPSEKKSWENN
jgi:hypothetical protein